MGLQKGRGGRLGNYRPITRSGAWSQTKKLKKKKENKAEHAVKHLLKFCLHGGKITTSKKEGG